MFIHKLTRNYEVAHFLENNLKLPMRLEVISNFNAYIKELKPEDKLISLNTNEWIVEHKSLNSLFDGFQLISNVINN